MLLLQHMVVWLLPREDTFYQLIERLTEKVEASARELDKLSTGVPSAEVYEAICLIERDADRLLFEADEEFARVFVTPIDRGDLQVLIVAIHDIIVFIHLAARAFVLYSIPKSTPAMSEQMRLLVVLGELLRVEIAALRRQDYERLMVGGRTILEYEKAGEKVFCEAVAALFCDPEIDARVLLSTKHVLEDLDHVHDKFQAVAERLKNLAIKYG
jgi:uncharacterized protein Yka (UPF0111/DUF47 family)